MNTLQIIKQQEVLDKQFKVYGDFENPLFLAKDVAEWIENSNTSQMLNSIDDDEKLKSITPIYNVYNGQSENQECWFLTESGLYEVLMQSRKPIAKAFKKEVKVILKEIRQTGTYSKKPMSQVELILMQAQTLVDMDNEQKRLATELKVTNQRIEDIKEVVSLDTRSWRTDSKAIIAKTAQAIGGFDYIRDVQTEIYKTLEYRASVSLSTRLTNKRRRMADEGICTSKRNKVTKVDIIAEDKKLIEIYIAIVKEIAIKNGIALEHM